MTAVPFRHPKGVPLVCGSILYRSAVGTKHLRSCGFIVERLPEPIMVIREIEFVEIMDDVAAKRGLLLQRVKEILNEEKGTVNKLLAVCELLRDSVAHYDWVGFYLVDPKSERGLILGPYKGEPTDHVRIRFGRGICGQVASSMRTKVVPDVKKEPNYLACSKCVLSEIVVPILRGGKLIGVLDIDSHEYAPFNDDDRNLLEDVCRSISPFI